MKLNCWCCLKKFSGLCNQTRKEKKECKKWYKKNKMKPKEQHPMYGKHLTKEWKENLSKSLKGRKKSDEQKQKISQKLKGIKRSEETRKKIGQAQVGKKLSEETKMKISLAMKKKKTTN